MYIVLYLRNRSALAVNCCIISHCLEISCKEDQITSAQHSAILSTFIKLPFVIKIFVLSILSGRFTQILLYVVKIQLTEGFKTV